MLKTYSSQGDSSQGEFCKRNAHILIYGKTVKLSRVFRLNIFEFTKFEYIFSVSTQVQV